MVRVAVMAGPRAAPVRALRLVRLLNAHRCPQYAPFRRETARHGATGRSYLLWWCPDGGGNKNAVPFPVRRCAPITRYGVLTLVCAAADAEKYEHVLDHRDSLPADIPRFKVENDSSVEKVTRQHKISPPLVGSPIPAGHPRCLPSRFHQLSARSADDPSGGTLPRCAGYPSPPFAP